MEVVEAERLAAAEGLSLVPAATTTGFKGICKIAHTGGGKTKPFQAKIQEGGKQRSLGTFASAAEAALAVARHLGPAGCATALAPPAAAEPPMTEAEARRLAAEEGLQLVILDAVPVSGEKRARVS